MSAYVPVDFVDGVTPLNAETFNHLEDQVELLDALKVPDPTGLDEKWLKAESGAMVWVDPPAGGGGGGIEYENAWGAATAYVPGDVVEHEGIEYLAVNPSTNVEPTPQAAPPANTPIPLVTALPALPQNGDEVILVDSLTAPTYQWRLRYVLAKTTNKWVFVGGSPLYAYVAALETVTSSTYTNLTTPGPSIAIPVAGAYEVDYGHTGQNSVGGTGAAMSLEIGAAAAVDADYAIAGTTMITSASRKSQKSLAAVTLTAKYRATAGGGTASFSHRWISARPIAVGG